MDQNLKSKWVEALRSGKYPQGQRSLHHTGLYCCLGVLAECAGPIEWTGSYGNYPQLNGRPIRSEDGDWLEAGFAGLSASEQAELASMNDSGSTFIEIADHIEKNL